MNHQLEILEDIDPQWAGFYNREFFLAYSLLISPIFMFSSEIIV
jgi:hypothetical protein